MRQIRLTGSPPKCTLEIDGQVIPFMGIDLHVDCESVPTAAVRLPVFDADVTTEGDVAVDEHTRKVLLALGWLPPEHETITYRDCQHPAIKAISDRLEQSDEALSAAWLRKVIAESA